MNQIMLPDEIFSIEQLQLVLNDIDQYLESLTKRNMSPDIHLNRLSVLFFETNGVSEVTMPVLNDLKVQLSKLLRDKPRINIRTAHPVIENAQTRINDWVKRNISKNVLLSFHDDHTLLAGVLIQTPSNRFDYTLRKGLKTGRKYLASEVHG